MATLQQNINKAVEDFYSIKVALNNAGINAEGATAEYANKINTIVNDYYYNKITNDNSIIVNNHLDYLTDYTIYGNTYQESTPTLENPSEPQFVGDKTINLLNQDTMQLGWISTSTGDITSSATTKYSDYIEVQPNTSYVLTFEYQELAETTQRFIICYDTNKTFLSGFTYNIENTNSYLITTDSTTNFLRVSSDINCYNLMLIEGLTAPNNFIPYGYEILIKSLGKNLLKNNCISTSTKGIDVSVNSDGSITLDNTSSDICVININTNFKLDTNQQYKLVNDGDSLPSGVYLSIRQKDSESIIADLSSVKTKEFKNVNTNIDGIFKCYIYIPNDTTFDNLVIKPMVTLVNNDSTYEAYEEHITNLYFKEPLCKINNIADTYNYQTNTISRKIQKITFNDGTVFSSITPSGTDGWYYTSYPLVNTRNYNPAVDTSVYGGFITNNIYNVYHSPVYIRWATASSSTLRLYIKDSYLNTFEGETLQDKVTSFVNENPFTIWYPASNETIETPINAGDKKIYTSPKEIYNWILFDSQICPSQINIKYNKSSNFLNILNAIGNLLANAGISDNDFNNYPENINNKLIEANSLSKLLDRSITEIIIPNDITNVGSQVFNQCRDLVSVTIPDGVTNIGSYAFCNCNSLININIPNSVVSLQTNAFVNCNRLTDIVIPSSVERLTTTTFSGCTALTNVTLGNNFNANNLDLSASALFSADTLVAMLNALADRTGLATYTLTLGDVNLAKLSNEQITIATSKNWILA